MIKKTLIILLSGAILALEAFAQAPRVRKSIEELTPTELDNYIHALNKLRERTEANFDDEKGYGWWERLHNDTEVGPCEHGNDLFLAWHRAHLYYFEDLLRASDPPRTSEVTIPYWDWINEAADGKRYPAAFSKPGLNVPPLPSPQRNPAGIPLAPDTLAIIKNTPNWNEFGGWPNGSPMGNFGDFELGPHNRMHSSYIGGLMRDPSTAAEDPIYWSFHCFIDLCWAEWQRRNNSPAPTSPNERLRGFLNQNKHRVSDFQSLADLGYSYLYTKALNEDFEIQAAPSSPANLTMPTPKTVPLQAIPPQNQPEAATITPSRHRQMAFKVPADGPSAERAIVRISDLKVPTRSSYDIEGYLHPRSVPFESGDKTFREKYGVGYISMWRSHTTSDDHAAHAHHPATANVRFKVGPVLARLQAANATDLVLTLVVVPAPSPVGGPLTIEAAPDEVKFNDIKLEYPQ